MCRVAQCSCLENPRDGGAWRAAVYGVAQSRTRLKQLSSSSNGETHIENRLMDTQGGKEGEGEIYGKSNMETYNAICKIDSQWEFVICLRKPKRALYQPRGWDKEGDGREV